MTCCPLPRTAVATVLAVLLVYSVTIYLYVVPSLHLSTAQASRVGWAWWSFMLAASLFNFVALVAMLRSRAQLARPAWERKMLRVSAIIFTAVAAFRSTFPRIDVPRTCWFDTPLNWVVFGRLAATVAELVWAVQIGQLVKRCAACLHRQGRIGETALSRLRLAGTVVIACACTGECCSWTNLITEDNLMAVVEQALWSALFLIAGAAVAYMMMPITKRRGSPVLVSFGWWLFLAFCVQSGVEQAYEAFGLYLPRFHADQASGKVYRGFADGFAALLRCKTTSNSINVWSADAAWMTSYFTVGVWTSLWICVAPLPATTAAAGDGGAAGGISRGGGEWEGVDRTSLL